MKNSAGEALKKTLVLDQCSYYTYRFSHIFERYHRLLLEKIRTDGYCIGLVLFLSGQVSRFLHLFCKMAFSVAMHGGLVFVFTKVSGNVFLVDAKLQANNRQGHQLQQEQQQQVSRRDMFDGRLHCAAKVGKKS